ncbi:glycine reductase [Hespellia stercorisuis DSM 15480]|uniref:Glycine reductase n=2 Tax=Hespellia stercorisuis TaxID=180311 RepID=A0A1M6M4J4_9FIRM|nr:glycine reductase [Hespellia stercorisuis DSM 15480]
MSEKIRVVHYINQFYGGYGGEDTASMGIVVKESPEGPGLLLKSLLGDDYEIVATIICGDNYIAENTETVCQKFIETVKEYGAKLFVAGPGFNAGRYGLGCGAATAAVTEQLKIPAVTALYAENPGTDLYKDRSYILQTENNAAKMKAAMKQVAAFAKRLVEGDFIGDGKKEGYHGSGPAVDIDYTVPACKRGLDMLLNKYYHRNFHTEVVMPNHEDIPIPVLAKPLNEIKLAFVTDGGLVPKGNPDKMVPTNSKFFNSYSFEGVDKLDADDYEVSHQGYNNAFVLEDPNRLVPVDAAVSLEKEGKIGSLYASYYTTAGVMTPMEVGKKFGDDIAQDLKEHQVDAVILTST